jgi:hypothetical protein
MRKRINMPTEVVPHVDEPEQSTSMDGPGAAKKWKEAAAGAIDTAKKATALAKAHLIRESRKHGGRWQWVDFPGPNGRESAGIVDILAIRKRWDLSEEPEDADLKHLDLLDIMLIQVKGGAAKTPSAEDIARMERVADRYHIGKVLLYQWNTKKKAETGYRILNRETHEFGPLVTDSKELFGKKWTSLESN